MTDATHAIVKATLRGDAELAQRYVLVREADGWRVVDIVHPANGSLVEGLKVR